MECARQEEKRINRRSISTIPIFRYHVANLSLETPTILNRHLIRIISKHTINRLHIRLFCFGGEKRALSMGVGAAALIVGPC